MPNRIAPPLRARALRFAALALLLAALAAATLGSPTTGHAQTTTGDYDTDDDYLIEVRSLAQLNAIRWDMDGNGTVSPTDAANYLLAFPNRITASGTPMGCPGACAGYELAANLDFDTDGDGDVDADDSNGAYWNGGEGWMPLGGHTGATLYTTVFEGNGHTISNLFINQPTGAGGGFVGLFSELGANGKIRNVGLINPSVTNARTGAWFQAANYTRTGALLGSGRVSTASVSGSYVSGGTVQSHQSSGTTRAYTGCLVGFTWDGTYSDNWASCNVTATGGASTAGFGGLFGGTQQTVVRDSYATGTVNALHRVGGLIGHVQSPNARVIRSYATGNVTGNGTVAIGGLVGFASVSPRVIDSYATGAVSGCCDAGGLVGSVSTAHVTGSYATGNVTSTGGDTGGLVGEVITGGTVRASYATGDVSSAGAGNIGGLVGRLVDSNTLVNASYATGNVTASAGNNDMGGLVGEAGRTIYIRASYATGTVSSSSSGNDTIGGLIGYTTSCTTNYPRVIDSYTISALSNTGTGTDVRGGLVATVAGSGLSGCASAISQPIFATSYSNSEAAGHQNSPSGFSAASRTTSQLQAPTGYDGIYANWAENVWEENVGADCNNQPWDFGTSSQYPILVCQTASGIAEQQIRGRGATATDYDDDNDGLIDVSSLAQLNAIRYDLGGLGHSPPFNGRAYEAAFPGLTAGMGCPAIGCAGYELLVDLDFASDSDYADWTPIGTYSGVFDGRGHPMSNLAITSATGSVGLFSVVQGPNALLAGVSLPNVDIDLTSAPYDVGAAGFVGNGGAVRTSYASGTIAAPASGANQIHAGGLVGRAGGPAHIAASYSQVGVTVTSDAPGTATHNSSGVGGLVGELSGAAGNLAQLTATYATGAVSSNWTSANPPLGGLVGLTSGVTRVRASYWDTDTSGIADDADDNPPEGQTTAALQRPTRYAGIYETWDDYDLDGDGEANTFWVFGRSNQYPTLDPDEHAAGECPPNCPTTEPEEYVAPPIVYNLNIRFSVKGFTLDEGESATYQVRMSQAPVGHPAKVSVTSNNPDVTVSPTALTFSSANYREWQTVSVSVARDANDTDESANIAHRGPNLSYGSILVTVNDIWPGTTTETVNGHTLTLHHAADAPAGVTVTAPDTLDANAAVTVSAAPANTPLSAPGYGFGAETAAQLLASIRVQGAPSDGLTICLAVPAALVTEAGDRPLTLLRHAAGAWAPVAGAAQQDGPGNTGTTLLCAAGVTEYGIFAAAYAIPDALGVAANLAAAPSGAGTVILTWTPAANATVHFVFAIKKSDAEARNYNNLAAWGFTDRANAHTISNLESGAPYYFTIIGGRARPNGTHEWAAWTPLLTATPN